MVKSMKAAVRAARRALEATYDGACTVIEYRETEDAKTGLSGSEEVTVIEDQPCKLSFETLRASDQTETAATVAQGTKLFLAPEVVILAGSKIIVTQSGVTGEYSASGVPAVYATHQEIMLELFERWA